MGILVFIIIVFFIVFGPWIFLINLNDRLRKLEEKLNNQKFVTQNQELKQQPILSEKKAHETSSPILEEHHFDKELYDYVLSQIKVGVEKRFIQDVLIKNGWPLSEINKAISKAVLEIGEQNIPAVHTENKIVSDPIGTFGNWLKEDWLVKLGALLLLVGFGWFTTYAFLNDWIGPIGRISLGLLAGLAFIVLGWFRIWKFRHQGGIFLVLGSTTVLITVFAAREIYEFFTPVTALALMFLSVIFVAVASVRFKSQSLALSSLVLAGVAPLLTNVEINYIWLFSYLLAVVLGVIWIVFLTGHRDLVFASLLMIVFYSFPHLASIIEVDQNTQNILLLFIFAFVLIFFVANTVGICKNSNGKITADLVTAGGNGLLLIYWISLVVAENLQSIFLSSWMLVFVIGAFVIFKITKQRNPFYVYSGVGVVLLASATAASFSGPILTIAYTIEAAFMVLLTYLLTRDFYVTRLISLLLFVPAVMGFQSIANFSSGGPVINEHFFVLLILSGTLMFLGAFFYLLSKELEDNKKWALELSSIFLIFGSGFVYALLWLSLSAGIEGRVVPVLISLTVYTVVGLVCYFYGLLNQRKVLRLYGSVLIAFVVGRLFLVDVWNMELSGRIVTFFVIGFMLLSTAFLSKYKVKHLSDENIKID